MGYVNDNPRHENSDGQDQQEHVAHAAQLLVAESLTERAPKTDDKDILCAVVPLFRQ